MPHKLSTKLWALNILPNKRHMRIPAYPLHISQAAVHGELSTPELTTLWVLVDNQKYAVCTLHPDHCPQQSISLNFPPDKKVHFLSGGGNTISLIGCSVIEDDEAADEGDEDEDDEGEEPVKAGVKRPRDDDEGESERVSKKRRLGGL